MRSAMAVTLVALLAGCSESGDGCKSTADCAEGGSTGLACVDGACVRICSADTECADSGPNFVCERKICVQGCPTVACGAGQECVEGRCSYFFESFEAERVGGEVSLDLLGWNPVEKPLQNKESTVVYNRTGCTIEDEESKCAGAPADGSYFLSVERTPTPPNGTEEFGPTCGACRCCLECRDAARRDPASQRVYYQSNAGATPDGCGNGILETSAVCADAVVPPGTKCEECDDSNTDAGDGCSPSCKRELAECPGLLRVANMCTTDVDAACQDVCTQCDSCPDATQGAVGEGLGTCEEDAASKTCSACKALETCIAEHPTDREQCDEIGKPCIACREADSLTMEFPDQPSLWREMRQICDSQSLTDRCYATQVARPRSVLTESEQSVESPKIDLSSAGGDLMLEFQYVAFNIGDVYRQVDQSKPRDQWPQIKQEVEVQLCAANCTDDASWKQAKLTSGAAAIFPGDIEKNNGLYFANLNRSDWRANLREVVIPSEFHTAEFQFRFVPRLADGARVGVDAVAVKVRR